MHVSPRGCPRVFEDVNIVFYSYRLFFELFEDGGDEEVVVAEVGPRGDCAFAVDEEVVGDAVDAVSVVDGSGLGFGEEGGVFLNFLCDFFEPVAKIETSRR